MLKYKTVTLLLLITLNVIKNLFHKKRSNKKMKKMSSLFKRLLILVVVLCLGSGVCNTSFVCMQVNAASNDPLKVHYFNVGDADAMIIEKTTKNEKHYMLVDTGWNSRDKLNITYTQATHPVKLWMNANNVEKFDYVVITHYDRDHVAALQFLLDDVEVDTFLARKYGPVVSERLENAKNKFDSQYYDNYQYFLSVVNNKKANLVFPTNEDKSLRFAEDVILSFKNNKASYVTSDVMNNEKDYKEAVNNDSLVFHMKIDGTDAKYLFLGDLKKNGLTDYLDQINNKNKVTTQFSVLKVPHHCMFSNDTLPQSLQETFQSTIKSVISVTSRCVPETSNKNPMMQALDNIKNMQQYNTYDTYNKKGINNYCISTNGNSFHVYYETVTSNKVTSSEILKTINK